MSLLDTLLEQQGGAIVREIANQVNLPEGQARSALEQLVPALARGMSRNAKQPGGLESLIGALRTGHHERYVEKPSQLGDPSTIDDGNSILGHIFGSKDVSRNVAGHAAAQTGISAEVLKKMLPMVAAAAMGAMGKQTQEESAASSTGGGGLLGQLAGSIFGGNKPDPGMAGMLESFLDSDKDGAVVDDLFSMAKKFF